MEGDVDLVRFGERLADLLAEREGEGVGHGPADENGIGLIEETVDDLDLVRDLRTAEDDDEGTLGALEFLAEVAKFLFHEETDGALGDELGHTRRGRVGAVRGPEGVVHVDIGELGQLLAEGVIVGFLFVVEAEIFEQDHFAVLELGGGLFGHLADAIIDELHRHADQFGKRGDHGKQALLRIALALGAAKVGAEKDTGTLFDQVLDRGNGGTDALVIGDDLDAVLFLERDVVIDTDEDAFAFEWEVADGDFGHRFGRKGEGNLDGMTKFDGINGISFLGKNFGPDWDLPPWVIKRLKRRSRRTAA